MGRVAIVTGGAGFLGSHLIDRLLLGFDFAKEEYWIRKKKNDQ